MSYNKISFFQFDNLIQSRIPMALFLIEDVEIQNWYNSIVKMHLEIITHRVSASEILPLVEEKKWDPQFGILILDKDGKQSQKIVAQLEEAGYLNVFSVEGGYNQLFSEKTQNQN